MTQRLFDTYAKVPKLVSHLHLPVQAGSDRVLAAMKRGYTAIGIQVDHPKACARRGPTSRFRRISSSAFRRDRRRFRKDHEASSTSLGFDTSFSFIYSPAPARQRVELADDTPAEGQVGRLTRLQKRIEEQAHDQPGDGRKRPAGAGRGPSEKDANELAGALDNNRVVNFVGNPRLRPTLSSMSASRAIAPQPEGRDCHPCPDGRPRAAPTSRWPSTTSCSATGAAPWTKHPPDRDRPRRDHPARRTGALSARRIRAPELPRTPSGISTMGPPTLSVDEIQLGLIELINAPCAHRAAGGRPMDPQLIHAKGRPARPHAQPDRLYPRPSRSTTSPSASARPAPARPTSRWPAPSMPSSAIRSSASSLPVRRWRPASARLPARAIWPRRSIPYLRPLYDALYDLMGFDRVAKLYERGCHRDRAPGLHARADPQPRLHHSSTKPRTRRPSR